MALCSQGVGQEFFQVLQGEAAPMVEDFLPDAAQLVAAIRADLVVCARAGSMAEEDFPRELRQKALLRVWAQPARLLEGGDQDLDVLEDVAEGRAVSWEWHKLSEFVQNFDEGVESTLAPNFLVIYAPLL